MGFFHKEETLGDIFAKARKLLNRGKTKEAEQLMQPHVGKRAEGDCLMGQIQYILAHENEDPDLLYNSYQLVKKAAEAGYSPAEKTLQEYFTQYKEVLERYEQLMRQAST